jgi:hypothetical protein
MSSTSPYVSPSTSSSSSSTGSPSPSTGTLDTSGFWDFLNNINIASKLSSLGVVMFFFVISALIAKR